MTCTISLRLDQLFLPLAMKFCLPPFYNWTFRFETSAYMYLMLVCVRKIPKSFPKGIYGFDYVNKTNHPISSNIHPSATVHKTIHCLKLGGG